MTGLVDRYELVVLDLDGVVVLGDRPVDGAPEALRRLREMGKKIRFATNNASRRRDEVAAMLAAIGVAADPGEVLTSAAAAASVLGERLAPGARVLVVGYPQPIPAEGSCPELPLAAGDYPFVRAQWETLDQAMQTFGAMGMTKEMPLHLFAQQARLMRIYEGPTEVHRMAIAKRVLRRGSA